MSEDAQYEIGKLAIELRDIGASLFELSKLHRTITTHHGVVRIRQIADMIEYFELYGLRKTYSFVAVNRHELRATACSVAGCHTGLPHFNLANRPDVPADWRCLAHIPDSVTFPIGLHGDEWVATGRKPVVWKAGR